MLLRTIINLLFEINFDVFYEILIEYTAFKA